MRRRACQMQMSSWKTKTPRELFRPKDTFVPHCDTRVRDGSVAEPRPRSCERHATRIGTTQGGGCRRAVRGETRVAHAAKGKSTRHSRRFQGVLGVHPRGIAMPRRA
jgi:hypothetical protein